MLKCPLTDEKKENRKTCKSQYLDFSVVPAVRLTTFETSEHNKYGQLLSNIKMYW